jgi:hypothetical protein
MARLAPSFFDTAVMDREASNRAEQRPWMATWEPALARAYGTAYTMPADVDPLPPLPPPRIQREVERHLAAFRFWMEAGRTARERHQQRHPHALLSFCRMARLLDLAFEFKKLALGLDFPNPLPEKITYDYNFTDFKRAYGHQNNQSPPVDSAPAKAVAPQPAATSMPVPEPKSPPPAWPPRETKRDITPVKLVRGPHGFLTYEYPKPDSTGS